MSVCLLAGDHDCYSIGTWIEYAEDTEEDFEQRLQCIGIREGPRIDTKQYNVVNLPNHNIPWKVSRVQLTHVPPAAGPGAEAHP